MPRFLLWGIVLIVTAVAADRLLLWMESRGWVYYRRKKPNWSASVHHLMEMQSVFDPGAKQVMEARVQDEQDEDESGEPPGAGGQIRDANQLDDEPVEKLKPQSMN